jgi:hypothetical protein
MNVDLPLRLCHHSVLDLLLLDMDLGIMDPLLLDAVMNMAIHPHWVPEALLLDMNKGLDTMDLLLPDIMAHSHLLVDIEDSLLTDIDKVEVLMEKVPVSLVDVLLLLHHPAVAG